VPQDNRRKPQNAKSPPQQQQQQRPITLPDDDNFVESTVHYQQPPASFPKVSYQKPKARANPKAAPTHSQQGQPRPQYRSKGPPQPAQQQPTQPPQPQPFAQQVVLTQEQWLSQVVITPDLIAQYQALQQQLQVINQYPNGSYQL